MRVRPQSYLLPAVLFICLFFCTTVYSEKKNSANKEEADRDVKFYNDDYKKRVAGSNRDIISYNNSSYHDDENYEEYNTRKEAVKPGIKKEQYPDSINNKKKNSVVKNSNEFVYYIVKNGDTLFSIAKRSGISLKKIKEINNLDGNSKIYKGIKLKIPNTREIKNTGEDASETAAVKVKPLFLWPLKKIKGCFRDGKDGVKPIGIVIKGNPGSEVIASENGVVKKVGYMRGYGKYIVVKHEKKYMTVYSNLMEVDVKAGDKVRKGGRIGNISDDMTLHFQIDRNGKPENPLNLLPIRG